MAFTVVDCKGVPHTWHVGDKKPDLTPSHRIHPSLFIWSLYADGHELQRVEQKFKNVPVRSFEQPTLWRGEMAQFIFDNL